MQEGQKKITVYNKEDLKKAMKLNIRTIIVIGEYAKSARRNHKLVNVAAKSAVKAVGTLAGRLMARALKMPPPSPFVQSYQANEATKNMKGKYSIDDASTDKKVIFRLNQ